jgi:branched-subunit amino acid transport protein
MQNDLNISMLIVGMLLVAALSRSFFMLFGEYIKISPFMLEAIRFAPLAAMIAILAPEIFLPANASSVSQFDIHLPNIWGGIAALIAFYFSRKMLFTLAVGMAVFAAIRFWA